ncbi:phosphopeptide-binding protein [Lewinella sp. W8]|uniref:phosphopeptide-binding protein n=1 Tax=Lewinella sp. W8 TaxID=2528208 RepID=UPI0010676D6A|nr:phosphopeptide-binding protein [Lewinella sp. W8]MTB50902.1 phosphopeptide-binding protein [Lewinella sp. W8]
MRITSLLTLMLMLLLTVACGNSESADTETEETMESMEEAPVASGITLTPMPATSDFPDATITDWTYADGKFNYSVSGYEFGMQTPDADQLMCANSAKGQHAHLILNNEPYIAKYEPTFEQEVPDGKHYILTFLSRSYHESIKTDAAYRAIKAQVEGGSFTYTEDITEPMVFYSRPKGTYTGKANTDNVMLDFYPVNVELGKDGYSVRAVVNGTDEFTITEWQPYYLKGLPIGENTVELSLMKDGEVVNTPYNPVTRTFTLAELPTEQ